MADSGDGISAQNISNSIVAAGSSGDSSIKPVELKDDSTLGNALDMSSKSVQLLQMVLASSQQQTAEGGGRGDEGQPRPTKHAPQPLTTTPKTFSEIRASLQSIIQQRLHETSDKRLLSTQSRPGVRVFDDVLETSVISHALASFLTTIEPAALRKTTMHIVADAGFWIARLFRFFDSAVFFHDEAREGIVRSLRAALLCKYPKLATEGYEALYPRPPVIYMSPHSWAVLGVYICTQLSLPHSCIRVVPYSTVPGSHYKMNMTSLETYIAEDVARGRQPAAVVATAGSASVGQVDSLQRLQELCKSHEMWLHVEGHCLAALCLVTVPNLPARTGDSVTLPLGAWLGLPTLPYVTLYKNVDSNVAQLSGLNSFGVHGRLHCLPLWVTLQSLGHQGVVQRILHSFKLAETLIERLEKVENIELVGKRRITSKEGTVLTLADVVTKSVSTLILFDIVMPVVAFRYNVRFESPDGQKEDEAAAEKRRIYFNNVNSWLCQMLKRESTNVCIDLHELEHHGVCLRFCPLESAHAVGTTMQNVEDLYNILVEKVAILNATVLQRPKFRDAVEATGCLKCVEVATWAGLGAVRYIPQEWLDRLNELTDSGKEEINRLNSELVVKLKSTDSAFSLGEGDDGIYCIRFGMISSDQDMATLVDLVASAGRELEESSKALETMSELVKQGIEEAKRALQAENEDKLIQEGLLRHVPIVGSLFSWWSPPPSQGTGVKGRSFNISSGIIESTENIYKYHMQIQQSDQSSDGGAITPPPQNQVRIEPKQRAAPHSRTSSHDSIPQQQSQQSTPSQAQPQPLQE